MQKLYELLVHTLDYMSGKTEKRLDFEKNETQNEIGTFGQNLMFQLKCFFQMPLENFPSTLRKYSMYLKGLPDLHLCVSKRIVTTRYTNQKA